MSVFGPRYPPTLQAVINHAERFAALVSKEEGRLRPFVSDARTWLIGRASEIETVVGGLVVDWRDSRRSEAATAASIASYLSTMHAAGREHLGLGVEAGPCCRPELAETEPFTAFPSDKATNLVFPRVASLDDTAAYGHEPTRRRRDDP
jgi:hypothetical protein